MKYLVHAPHPNYFMICTTIIKYNHHYNKKTGKYKLECWIYNLIKSFKSEIKNYPMIFYVKKLDDAFYIWLVSTNEKNFISNISHN